MKYKWIELSGYAGFYNGMGLTQIKIDFTKCKTNKIIIRGSNGSGKSTLINSINPNPDTNDKFIPGMEARKNICLENDGIEYIIKYIHPVNNKGARAVNRGYISKSINGEMVELNPNGNIKSCKDIIYNEFYLDSNYISLAALSSENRGLVDSRPGDRKKLINSILNILDVYNGIYKNLSKKALTYKHLIDSLIYKIDYIGDEVKLKARLNNIENRLKVLEKEKETTIEAIAAVRVKITEYMNILKENNYDNIVKELKDVSSHNKITRKQIENKIQELGINDINSIESFYNYIDKQIILYESEITSLKDKLSNLLREREVEYNNLQSKQTNLDSLQNEYNYLEIKNAVEESRKIIEEYDKVFTNAGLMNISMITTTEFYSAMESLKYLKELAIRLTSNYHQSIMQKTLDNETEINNINVKNMEIELSNKEKIRSDLEKKIAIFTSKLDIINTLKYRPKDCKIDSCPYIESAVKTSKEFPISELENMEKRLDLIKDEITILSNNIDEIKTSKEILVIINSIRRELRSRMAIISKLPIINNFEETFIQRIINLDDFKDIDSLYSYIDLGNMIEEYKVAQNQLQKYESEYKLYEAKNSILESIICEVEDLSKKLDTMLNQVNDINGIIKQKEIDLNNLKSAKSKVESLLDKLKEDLLPSEQKESELLKIKQTLDSNTNEIDKLQEELLVLNSNLGSVNNDLKALNEEKNNIDHSLLLLSDYKNDLDIYNTKYTKIEKIRYYSSPSTGIQTLFMQIYMNKIINTANNLLSMLFDGEFTLQPFIINENEFRIPCIGSGLLHDDISSMSTAQKCMISMILSFSILYQSSSKYNILSLDEVDAGLDTMNRGYFIELLDKLMNLLYCEQCFIISHNNELNTAACDLILLKNNSNEVFQGNVIWQY